jgi:hypothetical protein
LPAAHAGEPVPLAVDPPGGSAVTRHDLAALAADAAQRAWELSRGDSDGGLSLGIEADLARRAAKLLGAGGGWGASPSVDALARRAGLPAARLQRLAGAWQRAGVDGVSVLDDLWRPPDGVMDEGRQALTSSTGAVVQVRHNRVTVVRGTPQLRFGRDGRWYRFDRIEGGWELASDPALDPEALLDRP